jgi:hypothetical protein
MHKTATLLPVSSYSLQQAPVAPLLTAPVTLLIRLMGKTQPAAHHSYLKKQEQQQLD